MTRIFHAVAAIIRWADWSTGALIALFWLGFLVALARRAPFEAFAGKLALFLLFAAANGALGYMVNNWGDRALDAAQGRANPFNQMPAGQGRAWLGAVAVAAILTALPFWRDATFMAVWGILIFALLAYSLPPLRLKTRGVWGVAAAAAAQYTLPPVLLFLALGAPGQGMGVLLVGALTVSGVALEISHQRFDRSADARSGAQTFAVRQRHARLETVFGLTQLLDGLAVLTRVGCAVLVLSSGGQVGARVMGILLGLATLGLLLLALPVEIRMLRAGKPLDPHYGALVSLPSRLLHETLPYTFLPVMLGLGLSFFDPRYALLLGAFLLWRVALNKPNWRLWLGLSRRQHA